MNFNKIIGFFILFLVFSACGSDDDSDVTVVEPELIEEQVLVDEALIIEYLETHFYNSEDFETPPSDFDFRIKIDTIAGDNADRTPLMQQVSSKTIAVASDRFTTVDEEFETDHTFYYLEARVGEGDSPTVADSTYVRYRGTLLDGTIFDGSTEIPIWFDLSTIQASGARGFTEGAAMFSAGGAPVEVGDGTFLVEGYGVGLVIFPSGLGYFNTEQTTIPAYSPLIFEIDLFAFDETDHDADGIPSIFEDLNDNDYLFDEEDDTDEDGFPNYLDADDDGDGTLTEDEDLEPDSDLTVDRDEDGDATNDLGDGNPMNDDTDGDGIPNYLDTDNDESRYDEDDDE